MTGRLSSCLNGWGCNQCAFEIFLHCVDKTKESGKNLFVILSWELNGFREKIDYFIESLKRN